VSSLQHTPRHRRRGVLEDMIGAGMTQSEMADELRVSPDTIRLWCKRLDVGRPRRSGYSKTAFELEEPDMDGDGRDCPECGRRHPDEASQQACMRRHARDRAAFLEAAADD